MTKISRSRELNTTMKKVRQTKKKRRQKKETTNKKRAKTLNCKQSNESKIFEILFAIENERD